MGDHSAIEWTDASWNPVTGCDKVSPGCAHCYAERLAPKVFAGQTMTVATADGFDVERRRRVFTDVMTHADRLDQPLHWRKPRRVFVNSMSDLFHEAVPDAFIDRVFAVMALAPQHTFQILTKRAERMRQYITSVEKFGEDRLELYRRIGHVMRDFARTDDDWRTVEAVQMGWRWPLPNVWLGVSVENQHFADERIPLLRLTPAAVRFISAEPLLGAIDIEQYLDSPVVLGEPHGLAGDCDAFAAPALDWVIVGGESGKGARPFDLAWARSIVAQCRDAGVACFVKQLGAMPRFDRDETALYVRDKKGGDPAEWPEDLRVRQFPERRP